MKVILASASPRRKELIKYLVDDFDIIVSNVEEKVDESLSPEEKAEEISYLKARAVYEKIQDEIESDERRRYGNNWSRYSSFKRWKSIWKAYG